MKQSELDDYQYSGEHPWRDEQLLRELYVEQELGSAQISRKLGCSKRAVLDWLHRFGIEVRPATNANNHASFATEKRGYEEWRLMEDYKSHHIRIHRLLAVAEFGFEEVAGNIVHHKNEIKWDNRPSNIELMTQSGHARRHNTRLSWVDKLAITEVYRNTNAPQRVVGDAFGIDGSWVSRTVQSVEGAAEDGDLAALVGGRP